MSLKDDKQNNQEDILKEQASPLTPALSPRRREGVRGSRRKFLVAASLSLSSIVLEACGDSGVGSLRSGSPVPTSALNNGKLPTPPALDYTPLPTYTPVVSPIVTRKSGALVVRVDQTKVLHPISSYIYGLAGGDEKNPNYEAELKPGLGRWGGNPNSRYNWVVGNAWNAARDWEFRNTSYDAPSKPGVPRYFFEEAIQDNKEAKIPTLLTIPTLGWVAKNGDSTVFSTGVPENGGPPVNGSEAINGYDPTANRQRTSVQSKARKGAPFVDRPNINSTVVYQDEWVSALVKKFGKAAEGGVKFYAMDNEPDLWSVTHTDVHPVRMGYEGVRDNFLEYANAVKDVDPTAMITGPVLSGWTSYFFSELDRGSDNFRTAADRKAHGNQAFVPWFLEQVRRNDEKTGRRTLDILDIHFYPQGEGVYDGKNDPTTQGRRLRSTRGLWDKSYSDESWISQPIYLIPRMYEWINQFYPETKLAITEWNWGSDETLNGGLAIANVLGIFGRENVYMAAYWNHPPSFSPGFYAFKMYTNFDGKGSSFGDQAIQTISSDYQNVSAYSALDSKTNRLRVILINMQPDKERDIELQLAGALSEQGAKVYELSSRTQNKLVQQPDMPVSGAVLEFKLPAYSAMLVDVQL